MTNATGITIATILILGTFVTITDTNGVIHVSSQFESESESDLKVFAIGDS